METLFTWLHLSDLHFRTAGSGGSHERVLAALRQDVGERADPRPDAIVVTGDIGWTGAPAEYAIARKWLLDAARALGLGPDRVFVVAGNHDVDRAGGGDVDPGAQLRLLSELREGRRRLDAALDRPADRALLTARLTAFGELASTFGPRSATGSTPLEWSSRVDGRGGLRVHLVGACTALISADDADRGELRLGTGRLERARAAIDADELVIVLGHHPLRGGWLADESDLQAWMSAHAHVLLTGQIHDDDAEEARAGHPGACVWIAAGASLAPPDQGESWRRLGWSLASVVRAPGGALSVRVSPRRWSMGHKRFLADDRILREGRAYAERPLRLRMSASAPSASPSSPPPGAPRTPAPPAAAHRTPGPAAVVQRTPAPSPARSASPAAYPRTPSPGPVRSVSSMHMAAAGRTAAPAPSRSPSPAATRSPAPEVTRSPAPPPPRSPAPEVTRSPAPPPPRSLSPAAPRSPAPARAPSPAAPRSPAPAPAPTRRHFEGPGALPATPIPHFVGRTNALATLRIALADPQITCVVAVGLGGVGKTSLVQHFVATEAPQSFDESAWIDARDLAGELGRVAKRFGWRHDERPPTVDEAGAFLREALERRRVLVVIDNVDPGMASVRAFPLPPASSRSRLVVTSRIVTLHEDLGRLARPLRLGAWDDATCRAHFREIVPDLDDASDADLDKLARRVGGLPLAVRLVAKQLLRPGVSVQSLLDRLDREPLEALDSAARGVERSVAATFQSSLEGLGATEHGVLLALAACAPATRAAVVAAVADVREDEAAMALEGLSEQSLVEWLPDAEHPFRLHDVVRLLLASLPGAADAEAAHDAWVRAHLDAHRAPSEWTALEGEVSEVLAMIHRRARQGDGADAWQALSTILGVLDRRGMYAELVTAATRVLGVVPPDSLTAASVLANLGLSWCSLGEIGKATGYLERALVIAEDKAWPEGQGLALGGLGRCCAAVGEWEKAIAFHQRAASLHELLGLRRAFANDLANVGLACRRTRDVPAAIDHLERALAIYEELDLVDGRAEVLGGLGLCFRDIAELDSAVEYFERALAIHEELGQLVGEAAMLGNLGNTYRKLGELEKAITYLERALAIYEKLALFEGQGTALGNLGACYRALGDHAKAQEHFERALAVLRRNGLTDDHPNVRMVLGAMSRPASEQTRGGPKRTRLQ